MFPLKITKNIYILGHHYFHCYLLKGKRFCALVEMGMTAMSRILIEQLKTLQAYPDYLIVTHPHSDHVSGITALKEAFPFSQIIAGEGTRDFIEHPKGEKAIVHEDRHVAAEMLKRGFSFSVDPITFAPNLTGCQIVGEGDELNLGDFQINFIAVSGHSPGNIAVHIPSANMILASDSLGNLYAKNGFFPVFFTGYNDYINTIGRLKKFNPSILGLAHNGFYMNDADIRRAFRDAVFSAESAKDRILKDKRDDEIVAREIFEHYYHDELAVFSPENILSCCRLLVRRVREIK